VGKNKDIREAVEEEFPFDPLVDAANITVKSMSGDVALNGTVPSYPQFLEAAKTARRIAGVTGVRNHLEMLLPRPLCGLRRSRIRAETLRRSVGTATRNRIGRWGDWPSSPGRPAPWSACREVPSKHQ